MKINVAKQTEKTKAYEIIPSMLKLIKMVIPALGHDQVTSFLDILDNSWDAGATKVRVQILDGTKEKIESYVIIDNGSGMNRSTLVESFRFANESPHAEGDLGRYGVGGTISCFTLGEKKTTITKTQNGAILVGELDSTIANTDCSTCIIRTATKEEINLFEKYCSEKNQGTIIIISHPRLKRLQYSNSRHLKNALVKAFSTTFYQRLDNNRKIFIDRPSKNEICEVYSEDPLYSSEENISKVKSTYTKKIDFKDSIITLRFMEINPQTSEPSDRSAKNAGLYYNRNNRLISAAQSHRVLWPSKHQSYNCGRVEISFSESLDSNFGLTALKNKVSPSQSVIDTIEKEMKSFRHQVLNSSRSTPIPLEIEELKKEDENWTKQLKQNAAILELPKSLEKSEDDKIIRLNKNSKSGTVSPVSANINRTPRGRIIPIFEYVDEPRTPSPYWYSWDAGNMYIYINRCHNFIKSHYNSNDEKNLIKKFLTATCLVAFDMSLDDEFVENIIVKFLEDVSVKLSKVDRSIT